MLALLALLSLAVAGPSTSLVSAQELSGKDAAGIELIEALASSDRHVRSPHARSGPSRLDPRLLGGKTVYAPYAMPCPSDYTWIRSASTGLSDGEKAYLDKRKSYLTSAVNTMATSQGLAEPPRTPTIAVALSGGGYRAMTVGLGMVQALMNASSESAAAGTGGWLDATTYMAGLSGGSWATAAFASNDGKLPIDLALDDMHLDTNLIVPEDGKVSFYYQMVSEVQAKANGYFRTQITDYWALALGNHLLPEAYHLDNSPNLTFSSLPSIVGGLSNGSLPMPIIIAAEREEGEYVIAENATIYEFTPWEFGSWAMGSSEKVIGAFTPLEYLGSQLNNGQANGTCYKGFDQLSFIAGTSSTLFNGALIELEESSSGSSVVIDAIESLLKDISDYQNDVSLFPNTFANWTAQTNPISDNEYITLIDAGETNQNVPLEPLLVHPRSVDAIIAFDNSADTNYSWPNGSALRTTYERTLQASIQANVPMRMPVVPSENGFINGGLNTRPTFFGCNETDTPLIVYVPDYPWSYYANITTYTFELSNDQARGVIENGMRSMTLNGSVSIWPQCLACAMTDRAFGYTTSNRSTECTKCFDTFCWNGVDDNTTPTNTYEPVLGTVPEFLANLTSGDSSAKGASTSSSSAAPSATSSSPARRRVNVPRWW